MFYSRLYVAPNANIIENTSPLQHAELHLLSVVAPTHFGVSYQDRSELRGLISQLQCIYSETAGFDKYISEQATKVIHRINRDGFPRRHEFGYCKGTFTKQSYSFRSMVRLHLLPLLKMSFFEKLDVAFAALEGHHFTHAGEISKSRADTLMHEFSSVPETAFLHHPTYRFHVRATCLLARWQSIIGEYEAKDKWICEHNDTMTMLKLVYRRAVRL
ncbi:hypothetical protein BD779DRAFT_249506 [Infundibulicybe gibba]|nr:hypothetical protein BD779DRAFT_249506 [Infundibulicybe gibba]